MEQNITVFTQHNFQFSYNCSDMIWLAFLYFSCLPLTTTTTMTLEMMNAIMSEWSDVRWKCSYSLCVFHSPQTTINVIISVLSCFLFSVRKVSVEIFKNFHPHITIVVRYERVKLLRRHGVDYRRKFSHERLHNSIRIASRNRNFLTFSQGLIIRLAFLSFWWNFHLSFRALALLSFSPSALD